MRTIAEALLAYTEHQAIHCRPGTQRTTAAHLGHVAKYFGSNPTPTELKGDLDAYIIYRREHGAADATINAELRSLRAALNHSDLKTHAAQIKLIREVKKLPEILDDGQLSCLLGSGPRTTPELACWVAAYSGLRADEIAHLQKRDINWDSSTIRVAAKGDWRPKSHQEREVPIHHRLMGPLWEVGHHLTGLEFLLGWSSGELSTGVVRLFSQRGVHVEKPGLHCLRRTWASRLLRATGGDLETVRQLGGWADIKTVQRYLGSTDALKRVAIEGLE